MKFISSKTLNKNTFFFLALSFCTLSFAPTSYACDPLGCLFSGHNQDTLILGEVILSTDNFRNVKVAFVFPQNQVKSLKVGAQITVQDLTIAPGKKYLMSLNNKDGFYIPAWGVHEIVGTNYSDAKLVKNESIDDEALQIFINSGGTERDFGFDYGGAKPVLMRNGEKQEPEPKEKSILWYSVGIGAMLLAGITALVVRKKK